MDKEKVIEMDSWEELLDFLKNCQENVVLEVSVVEKDVEHNEV